jgi:hypothetical protein
MQCTVESRKRMKQFAPPMQVVKTQSKSRYTPAINATITVDSTRAYFFDYTLL